MDECDKLHTPNTQVVSSVMYFKHLTSWPHAAPNLLVPRSSLKQLQDNGETGKLEKKKEEEKNLNCFV